MIDYHEVIQWCSWLSWRSNGMLDYHEQIQWCSWLSWRNNGMIDYQEQIQWYCWLSWRNDGMVIRKKYNGVADYHEETMAWLIIMKINKKYNGVADYHEETMVYLIIMKKYNGVPDYHEETLVWLIIIKYNSLTSVDYHDSMIDYHETQWCWHLKTWLTNMSLCRKLCLLIVHRMDPADRKHLQRLWLKLLQNITDYKGITDGLFAEGILTPALKEKVVSTVAL